MLASALEVVSPTDPRYLAYAYAPSCTGGPPRRLTTSPSLRTQDVSPAGAGASLVSYVVVWSHEDAGTGFLPFVEWGSWGRMTDIENIISFTVARDGAVSGARYLWGGEPPTGFPDSQTALKEVDENFAGTWWGHHPVLRDATGNDDLSDRGTTPFKFQLAPVAAPPAGQARDAVMDANPFTYEVMAQEVGRWYADVSTVPSSPEPGQAEQYAIVDLDQWQRGFIGSSRPSPVRLLPVVPQRSRLGLPPGGDGPRPYGGQATGGLVVEKYRRGASGRRAALCRAER